MFDSTYTVITNLISFLVIKYLFYKDNLPYLQSVFNFVLVCVFLHCNLALKCRTIVFSSHTQSDKVVFLYYFS